VRNLLPFKRPSPADISREILAEEAGKRRLIQALMDTIKRERPDLNINPALLTAQFHAIEQASGGMLKDPDKFIAFLRGWADRYEDLSATAEGGAHANGGQPSA
jgi:hypothetical protein